MRKSYRELQAKANVLVPDEPTIAPKAEKAGGEAFLKEDSGETTDSPLTPVDPERGSEVTFADNDEGADDEYDSDEGMIGGVFFVKDDGSVQPLEEVTM
jgi:hypothetical protein